MCNIHIILNYSVSTTECSPGYYGYNCTRTCGHCNDGSACDIFTGDCELPCEPGWQGGRCDMGRLNIFFFVFFVVVVSSLFVCLFAYDCVYLYVCAFLCLCSNYNIALQLAYDLQFMLNVTDFLFFDFHC